MIYIQCQILESLNFIHYCLLPETVAILLQELLSWAQENYQDFRFWNESEHLQERLLQKSGRLLIAHTLDGMGICSFGKKEKMSVPFQVFNTWHT